MEQGNDSVAKDLQIVMGLMAKNKIELPSTVVLKGEKIQPVDHTSLPDMLVGGGKEGGNPTPSTSTSSSNQADEKMETEEERIAKEFGKEDAAAKVYHCAVCHLEVSGEESVGRVKGTKIGAGFLTGKKTRTGVSLTCREKVSESWRCVLSLLKRESWSWSTVPSRRYSAARASPSRTRSDR
ncbi:hypothetical protein Fcan01_18057 [Folsomia candida]|uniref:Uncharacterized protein n=1 Tax=Folsomia candida TaxID=158441 RepID=A0A226DQ80_FOLCA|nr:hypothetical protein Fcan01_18057 [Folsomia candida]